MVVGGLYQHAFVSDLHIGSMRFDILKYREMLKRIKEENIHTLHLHVLGDVVEGKLNYKDQLYESLPMEIQEALAVEIISELVEVLEPIDVTILSGNHDRKWGINLLDNVVSELKRRFPNKEIVYYRDSEYYLTFDGILCIHGIRSFKGSDYTGVTPLMLSNVVELARSVEERAGRIRKIIVGHYHRYVNVEYMGYDIYILPSFQYTERPLRNQRGMVFIDWDVVHKIILPSSLWADIVGYWRERLLKSVVQNQ